MVKKITIVLTIPEPLYSKLNSEITFLHEKYSKECKNTHPNDGIYYDIPHITLFSMRDCFEHKDKIEEELRKIAKNFNPIKIKSKELTLFEYNDLQHLVITIDKTKELQELHNEIIKKLLPYSAKKDGFLLEQYNPHSSKILYLPKELGEKAMNDSKIKDFDFTTDTIGIKIRHEDHYCKIEEEIKLGEKQ